MGHNRYPHRALPSETNPTGTRCISLVIPDSDEWEQDIYAQVTELAKWYLWDRDAAKRGKPVADRWQVAIETWTHCMTGTTFDVRQNEEMPCTLEKTTDGETWVAWANLQICPPKIRIVAGKVQWFNPTTEQWENTVDQGDDTQVPPQPGTPTDTPTSFGDCVTIAFVVPANGTAIVPVPLEECWTVTTVIAEGAWAWDDSNPFENWACYDGHEFLLGACTSSDMGYDPSFPVPSAKKFSLVLRYPDATHGTQLVVGETITIPEGVTTGNFVIQMNDDDITNNQGSVSCVITFCKEDCTENPCVSTVDLTSGKHGTRFATDAEIDDWFGSSNNHYPVVGVYTLGTGYDSVYYDPATHRALYMAVECGGVYGELEATITLTVDSNGADLYARFIDADGVTVLYSHTTNVNGTDQHPTYAIPGGTKTMCFAQLSYANFMVIKGYSIDPV